MSDYGRRGVVKGSIRLVEYFVGDPAVHHLTTAWNKTFPNVIAQFSNEPIFQCAKC